MSGPGSPTGPIVVGVSPRTGSPAALRWGADEARLRNTTLRAVLAWRPPRPPAAPGGRPPVSVASMTSTDHAAEAEATLHGLVAAALGGGADVECVAVHGNETTALLEAAGDAQLLVLGEPRPGRLAAVRAGLVAPRVFAQARCPVVVMPGAT